MSGADIQTLLGPATLLVALFGLFMAVRHYLYLRQAPEPLAARLRMVFLTDAGIYIGSVLAGIWFFIGMRGPSAWVPVNIFEWLALFAQITASWRLYRHYKNIK